MDYGSSGLNFKEIKKPIAETMSQEEIFNLSKTASESQDRALICFIYLSGGRINECLQVQVRDIRIKSIKLKSGRWVKGIAINLLTLKRRKGIPRRTILVNPMGLDREMFREVSDLMRSRPSSDSMLFNYGDVKSQRARYNAYWHIKRIKYQVRGIYPPDGRMDIIPDFGLHPHYLRHCRTTHLVEEYGYNDHELMLYFGWASTSMAPRYTNINPVELMGKIVEVNGGLDIDATPQKLRRDNGQ
jgi:integrase